VAIQAANATIPVGPRNGIGIMFFPLTKKRVRVFSGMRFQPRLPRLSDGGKMMDKDTEISFDMDRRV